MDMIERAALAVRVKQAALRDTIADLCPGTHQFVRHRDGLPPWCVACRYTETGTRVQSVEDIDVSKVPKE